METIRLKKHLNGAQSERLKGKFINEKHIDTLITQDCDAYDLYGNLLFRFRKNAIPYELLKSGYDAFKGSIQLTEGRGITSGSSHKRIRKDGSVSKITVGNKVMSGNVGFMDKNAMIPYCRKTAFARDYFENYKKGIPFIQFIDQQYAALCPLHYAKQKALAIGTNKNYMIDDTVFTTVTVNENFRTAVHQDSGDYKDGFGNLVVYREGDYSGGYFVLPEYKAGIDMQNGDILFVDVHKWHGNTEIYNNSHDYKRVSFVMYYREYMYLCKQPSEELNDLKQIKNGFFTI